MDGLFRELAFHLAAANDVTYATCCGTLDVLCSILNILCSILIMLEGEVNLDIGEHAFIGPRHSC